MEGCHLSCSFYGCKRTYTNSESLNSHVKDHHKIPAQSLPGKVFLCSTIGCDGSFSNMQQLMDHMRHHHKPNYFFLCESCKAKLRSYRTLLKHLQTCAKVAKTKAIKTEAGLAADTDSGVPLAALELEPSGPLLATDESQQMESEPSLPLISAIQPSQKAPASGVLTQPTAMGLPAEVVAANAQRVAGQADAAFSPFPPRLSPVPPASLPETAQLDQQPPPAQWSPRIGPPCLPSSPPHTPPGSNAVWRKNQDLPASLLHRWTSSPANQALSREEVQGLVWNVNLEALVLRTQIKPGPGKQSIGADPNTSITTDGDTGTKANPSAAAFYGNTPGGDTAACSVATAPLIGKR